MFYVHFADQLQFVSTSQIHTKEGNDQMKYSHVRRVAHISDNFEKPGMPLFVHKIK